MSGSRFPAFVRSKNFKARVLKLCPPNRKWGGGGAHIVFGVDPVASFPDVIF